MYFLISKFDYCSRGHHHHHHHHLQNINIQIVQNLNSVSCFNFEKFFLALLNISPKTGLFGDLNIF